MPGMAHPNLYHLEQAAPHKYSGGELRGVSENELPILAGQHGSLYSVRLAEGGIREPHWHPAAWEMDYCIAGRARMTVLDPKGNSDSFEVGPGDVVFVPQGFYHYFENIGAGELHFLIFFNTSREETEDSIGIAQSIGVIPAEVLGAVFGASPDVFAGLPKPAEPLVLVRKPGQKTG
jgi:oxalate decarboxylase